jgi:hypothetical protein
MAIDIPVHAPPEGAMEVGFTAEKAMVGDDKVIENDDCDDDVPKPQALQ